MRYCLALFLALAAPATMQSQTPAILQIHRETPAAGNEAAYRGIEEDTAKLCATLGCPHPYLGAESQSKPKEVWFFNGYDSPAEQKSVVDGYAKNTSLMSALEKNSRRKASLTSSPKNVLANYRRDLSSGAPWALGQGRFLVIAITKASLPFAGTVFETADGTRFIVAPFRTLEEAETTAAKLGVESHVLTVRPAWSFPAKEWTSFDPEMWPASPRL